MRAILPIPLVMGAALSALQVDLNSPDSIKSGARQVAKDLLTYYHGTEPGQIVGILSSAEDYYWWVAGAMWGTLIDYWHYTKDDTYNKITREAMIAQAAPPENNFMPGNWTASIGNDDQGFWGMSAMLAAEVNFIDPQNGDPQWLALAQAVFNNQASPDRQDPSCGGGLRWQILPSHAGFWYKNSISNGCFFNLGARLARFTGNTTYSDWAIKTWDWMEGVGLIDRDTYAIYDGAQIKSNCTDIFKAEFSYNAAIFLQGAAYMYDLTNGSAIWQQRINRILNHTTAFFFPKGILVEVPCENNVGDKECNFDQHSFKGYMLRWMANTAQLAPFTRPTILPILRTNAEAVLKTCTGGDQGTLCGFKWDGGQFDGKVGPGEQMSALAALSVLLLDEGNVSPPLTGSTGGTSKGDPNAGGDAVPRRTYATITSADRAGAAILTTVTLVGLVGVSLWMHNRWSEGV